MSMDIVSYAMGRSVGVKATEQKILRITQQPAATVSGMVGVKAYPSVTATGEGLKYQWQYSTDGGTTWTNTTFVGAKTATLTITITAARNGYQYRCAITDANGATINSSASTLEVIQSGGSND